MKAIEDKQITDDSDWLKVRDLHNEITYAKQQNEKLKKQANVLEITVKTARDLCGEHKARETETSKRDAELRMQIKAEKEKFRELTSQKRAETKIDKKVF